MIVSSATSTFATAQYPVAPGERDRWILAHRPPRQPVNVHQPNAYLIERERTAQGEIVDVATLFLAGRECPWRCLMCDLWQHTTEERTPAGAIPAQISFALNELTAGHAARAARQIKLYNSGSFFDRAAIPLEDYQSIAQQVAGFERVIVESHPALTGDATLRFRDLLNTAAAKDFVVKPRPVTLEVAMGLETAHPQVLDQLNKRFSLDAFAHAAERLRQEAIALRVFVLIKPPFMSEAEGLEWAVRSTEFAFDCGATAVSLIPTRPGNGALEALAAQGHFAPPRLATVEAALERGLALGRGRVFVDLWDLEKFSNCPACFAARRERLQRLNLEQQWLPPIRCERCS